MEIKKGQMITFAEGEYSGYCVKDLVVADKDFDLDDLKQQWVNECCEEVSSICPYRNRARKIVKDGCEEFLGWLSKRGYVTDVHYIEVHTGSYGEVNITVSEY